MPPTAHQLSTAPSRAPNVPADPNAAGARRRARSSAAPTREYSDEDRLSARTRMRIHRRREKLRGETLGAAEREQLEREISELEGAEAPPPSQNAAPAPEPSTQPAGSPPTPAPPDPAQVAAEAAAKAAAQAQAQAAAQFALLHQYSEQLWGGLAYALKETRYKFDGTVQRTLQTPNGPQTIEIDAVSFLAQATTPVLAKHAPKVMQTPEAALLTAVLIIFAPKGIGHAAESVQRRRAAKKQKAAA